MIRYDRRVDRRIRPPSAGSPPTEDPCSDTQGREQLLSVCVAGTLGIIAGTVTPVERWPAIRPSAIQVERVRRLLAYASARCGLVLPSPITLRLAIAPRGIVAMAIPGREARLVLAVAAFETGDLLADTVFHEAQHLADYFGCERCDPIEAERRAVAFAKWAGKRWRGLKSAAVE